MRPASHLGASFWDSIAHRDVNYYVDYKGRCWMAHTRWGWFRVACGHNMPKVEKWQRWKERARG